MTVPPSDAFLFTPQGELKVSIQCPRAVQTQPRSAQGRTVQILQLQRPSSPLAPRLWTSMVSCSAANREPSEWWLSLCTLPATPAAAQADSWSPASDPAAVAKGNRCGELCGSTGLPCQRLSMETRQSHCPRLQQIDEHCVCLRLQRIV